MAARTLFGLLFLSTELWSLPIGHEILRELPASKVAWAQRRFRKSVDEHTWSPYILDQAQPPTIYPTQFGADPTGKTDSTEAFHKAIAALLARRSEGKLLANGIYDLGGAVLDLGGGDYTVSKPLIIPNNYGNCLVTSGTIRASSTFPTGDSLFKVGNSSCHNPQASCNENLGFSHLMFDGNLRAGQLLEISATMGTVVGPQNYFLGFTHQAAQINGGHETMIKNCWFGEYLYSDPRKKDAKATAIAILGNDHFVLDTIVFSSKVGVYVTGAANLLEGVHTWNLATPEGGVGIYIDAPGYTQNRVLACYLDYNDLIVVDPQVFSCEQSFFLISANIVVQSGKRKLIQGLNLVGNQFERTPGSIKLNGTFDKIAEVHVERNIGSSGDQMKATRASKSMKITNQAKALFDFSDVLLFPNIQHAVYSVAFADFNQSEGAHAMQPLSGNTVTIQFAHPVTATVYVDADQDLPA